MAMYSKLMKSAILTHTHIHLHTPCPLSLQEEKWQWNAEKEMLIQRLATYGDYDMV
jgi:hypothetical protein